MLTNNTFVGLFINIPFKIIEFFGDVYLGKIETKKQYFYKKKPGKLKDGFRYDPSTYIRLFLINRRLKLSSNDVFIDVGCGSGRVVFFFATRNIKKSIGLDLNRDLIRQANDNIKKFRGNGKKVKFYQGDASQFDLSMPTVFYFFNPFGDKTFQAVMKNIQASLKKNPREITIVYNSSVCKKVVDRQKWLKYKGRLKYFDVHFWSN